MPPYFSCGVRVLGFKRMRAGRTLNALSIQLWSTTACVSAGANNQADVHKYMNVGLEISMDVSGNEIPQSGIDQMLVIKAEQNIPRNR